MALIAILITLLLLFVGGTTFVVASILPDWLVIGLGLGIIIFFWIYGSLKEED